MLVLTRKNKEQIQIGDNITVTVLRVKGKSVRIGIEAPRDVRVVRSELPATENSQVFSARSLSPSNDHCPSSDNLGARKPSVESSSAQDDENLEKTLVIDDDVPPKHIATLHLLITRRQRRRSAALAH